MNMKLDGQRIFLKLERVAKDEVQLEFDFNKDEEKYEYIMAIASTPDVNSNGFIVKNSALINAWNKNVEEGKHVAAYEKHGLPVGKVVACEEINNKVLVVLEIPRSGNERVLAVYEQGIYVGLSIGGWSLDGEWDSEDIYHVTEFDWYEVSLTDIPSNENATLLECINKQKPQPKTVENKKDVTDNDIIIALENIGRKLKGEIS